MDTNDTKTRLMDAAEHYVRHTGADGFSYGDLAKDIGIRKASIHYHYPAKGDLLTAIMERYSGSVMERLENIRGTSTNPQNELAAFVRFYRDALQDGAALCLCVAYAVGNDGLPEDTYAQMIAFREKVCLWLEASLSKISSDVLPILGAKDPKAGAAVLLALVEGAQIAARIGRDVTAFDVATSSLMSALHT